MANDSTIDQRFFSLRNDISIALMFEGTIFLLAEPMVIVTTTAFAEKNLHHFCHVDLQKDVGVAKHSCESSKKHGLGNGVFSQVLLAE